MESLGDGSACICHEGDALPQELVLAPDDVSILAVACDPLCLFFPDEDEI